MPYGSWLESTACLYCCKGDTLALSPLAEGAPLNPCPCSASLLRNVSCDVYWALLRGVKSSGMIGAMDACCAVESLESG